MAANEQLKREHDKWKQHVELSLKDGIEIMAEAFTTPGIKQIDYVGWARKVLRVAGEKISNYYKDERGEWHRIEPY